MSVPSATPYVMNGVSPMTNGAAPRLEDDIALERDYRRACEWLGPMHFDDFEAGYRAMTEWYATLPFSGMMRRFTLLKGALRGRCSHG